MQKKQNMHQKDSSALGAKEFGELYVKVTWNFLNLFLNLICTYLSEVVVRGKNIHGLGNQLRESHLTSHL